MKQKYNRYSPEIVDRAVVSYLKGKWKRNDTLTFIEKYAGIPRHEILLCGVSPEYAGAKVEAVESISLYLQGVCEDLFCGIEPELDPVLIRKRPDGMTGKIRDIALLPVLHQLIEHVVVEMLMPLFMARFLPQQHASIPGHGQAALRKQLHKYLRSLKDAKAFEKTDVVHAYGTLQYSVMTDRIAQELPKAKELIILLRFLGSRAPGGHLIIGGYLDAWLFNLAMSYAIQYTLSLGQTRRGEFRPFVLRSEAYMDDVVNLCTSMTAAGKASKKMSEYLQANFGLSIKVVAGPVKLEDIEEERRRRHEKRKSARGSPGVDMAGFRVHRSYVTVRPRVFRRARRKFLKAWRELEETGTVPLELARKLNSYNGYFRGKKRSGKRSLPTDSVYVIRKYNIEEIMEVAGRVQSYHDRMRNRKELEELKKYEKVIREYAARCGSSGRPAEWPDASHLIKGRGSRRKRRRKRVGV